MKTTILAVVSTMGATFTMAQGPSIAIDTADKKPVTSYNKTMLADSRFSHSTSKGKVYILPYDNMPCLVPNMDNVIPMPGSVQKYPKSRMPNALPPRRND